MKNIILPLVAAGMIAPALFTAAHAGNLSDVGLDDPTINAPQCRILFDLLPCSDPHAHNSQGGGGQFPSTATVSRPTPAPVIHTRVSDLPTDPSISQATPTQPATTRESKASSYARLGISHWTDATPAQQQQYRDAYNGDGDYSKVGR